MRNRRPAGQSDGSDNLSAIIAADRAFPAAVAELAMGRGRTKQRKAVESTLHLPWIPILA